MSARTGARRRIGLTAFAWLVGFVLIAPTLIIVPMSFSSGSILRFPPPGFGTRWYANFFQSETWTAGMVTSLKVGSAAAILATVLGTLMALGLVRGRYPGRGIVMAIVLSPLIVPVVVIAIGMYFVYTDWRLAGTMPGLILAHTSLAIPFVVVNVSVSLRTFDRTLELAAQNLGAGPIRTFFRITLPIISPSIVAGALFAFISSWDEVVVSIFLSSPIVRTLPVVMWGQVRSTIDPTIAAVATMLSAVTLVVLSLVMVAQRRGRATR